MASSRNLFLEADLARILAAVAPPARRRAEPRLYLCAGLPGSGKSTFARRLAPRVDAVVLESDALRQLLFGRPAYTANESERLFRALHAAARRLLRDGASVIIDATTTRQDQRQAVRDIAIETGVRLRVLFFEAPEAVTLQRLQARARGADPNDASTADEAVYRRLAEAWQMPRGDYLRIDTSNAAACEAALNQLIYECGAAAAVAAGGVP